MKTYTALYLAVAALTVHNNGSLLPRVDATNTSPPVCRQLTTVKGTTTCVTTTTTTFTTSSLSKTTTAPSTAKAVATTPELLAPLPSTTPSSKTGTTASAYVLPTTKSKNAVISTTPSLLTTKTSGSPTTSSKTTSTGTNKGGLTTTKSTPSTTTKSRVEWSFPSHWVWSSKFHFSWTTRSHPEWPPRTHTTTSMKSGSATTSKASGSATSKSTSSPSILTTSVATSSTTKGSSLTTTMTTTKSSPGSISSLTTTTGSLSSMSSSSSSMSSNSNSVTSTSNSATSSSSLSSSSTSTSKAASPTFKITFQAPDRKLVRRFILYLTFSGSQGRLVDNAAAATDFTVVDGYLMTGSLYVVESTSSGYSVFSTTSVKPTTPGTWSYNGGSVSFGGGSGFCYTSDQTLVIIDSARPSGCTDVSLVSDAVLYTTTTPAATTSAAPGSSLTTGASSTMTSTLSPYSQTYTSMKTKMTTYGEWTTMSTASRTTTSSISCVEQVYAATSRCACTWSVRCNSHAVSEFGETPKVVSASDAFQCIELCNGNAQCKGLYFEPRTGNCYIFDAPGDNVLYGYNTGPFIAASPLQCDASCDQHLTTRSRTTTTSSTTASVPSGICTRAEEYHSNSGGCNCWWQIGCGTNVETTPDLVYPVADSHACCDICDTGTSCGLFIYDPADGNCRIWYDASQPAVAKTGTFWGVRKDNWCPKEQCPPGS